MAMKFQIACHTNSMYDSLIDLTSFVRNEKMVFIQVDASTNNVNHGPDFQ